MIKLSNKITNLQTKFEESIIKKNSGDKSEKKYSVSEVSMSKLDKSKNTSKSEFKHKRGVSESDLPNISQKYIQSTTAEQADLHVNTITHFN